MNNAVKTTSDDSLLAFRMISAEGFCNVFWEKVSALRSCDTKRTYEQIFDELNEIYFAKSGKYRYASYDSFRKARDKR